MVEMTEAKNPRHTFTWVTCREVVPSEYCPKAILAIGWKKLEERLGVVFGEYVDPDLGAARGVYFKIGEADFVIESLSEAPTDFEYIRILVSIRIPSDKLTDYLEAIMVATGITSTELTWVEDSIKFHAHEVWRQDDHGNKFLVERKSCKADAVLRANELTARGHKQMYWTEPVK